MNPLAMLEEADNGSKKFYPTYTKEDCFLLIEESEKPLPEIQAKNTSNIEYETYTLEEAQEKLKDSETSKANESSNKNSKLDYPTYRYEEVYALVYDSYDPRNYGRVHLNKKEESASLKNKKQKKSWISDFPESGLAFG